MNDLEFCKIQVEQIVTLYQAPDQIVAKVNELMTKRMPVERLHRRALRDWAQAEQSKAEALIASGKTVPLETMSNANRRMAMLQTVISAIEKFDAPSDVGTQRRRCAITLGHGPALPPRCSARAVADRSAYQLPLLWELARFWLDIVQDRYDYAAGIVDFHTAGTDVLGQGKQAKVLTETQIKVVLAAVDGRRYPKCDRVMVLLRGSGLARSRLLCSFVRLKF